MGDGTALQVALAEQGKLRVADQRSAGWMAGDGSAEQDAAVTAEHLLTPGMSTPPASHRPARPLAAAGAASVGLVAFLLGRRAGRRQRTA